MKEVKKLIFELLKLDQNSNNWLKILFDILEFNLFGLSVFNLLLILIMVVITLRIVWFTKAQILNRIKLLVKAKNIKVLEIILEQIEKIGKPFYVAIILLIVGKGFGLKDLTDNFFILEW
jgi:hypothetical protein